MEMKKGGARRTWRQIHLLHKLLFFSSLTGQSELNIFSPARSKAFQLAPVFARHTGTTVMGRKRKLQDDVDVATLSTDPPVPALLDSNKPVSTTTPKRRQRKGTSAESLPLDNLSIATSDSTVIYLTDPALPDPLASAEHVVTTPKRGQRKSVTSDSNGQTSNKASNPKQRALRKTGQKEKIHWKTELNAVILLESDGLIIGDNINGLEAHSSETDDGSPDTTLTTAMATKKHESIQLVRFIVGGKPRPLVRHRSSRGFIYNPSAEAQTSFRNVVQGLLLGEPTDEKLETDPSNNIPPLPLFAQNESLIMTMVFRLRRPNQHFLGGRRGPGRLRPTALQQSLPPPRPPDVDNLAKFVLDSLNGLLYADDRQVVSLHVTKLLDNEGLCLGSTEVCIQRVKDDEEQLERLLTNSFHLLG